MTATDQEIRNLTISLLKMKTARDKQTRIGASTLSNQCDVCLAHEFLGESTFSAIADRAWMGRVLGTAFHSILEQCVEEAKRQGIETLIGLHPEAQAERHVIFCDIPGYGPVGGTIDLDLVSQVIDWKGSTRKKIALLRDYLLSTEGKPAQFGRKHKAIAEEGKTMISEAEYAKEMVAMAYKVNGYFGQAQLYMRGAGRPRASLVFIARNGTAVFDNPAGARYEDETAVHDIFVLSFDYDAAYADALVNRGTLIWQHLERGGKPSDFTPHVQCLNCEKAAEETLRLAQNIDIEATFPAAA